MYKLPKNLRRLLKKPWGDLILKEIINRENISKYIKDSSMTVSVGDATTETLISLGIIPDVQIIDSKEMRLKRTSPYLCHITELKARNPAGYLSIEALQAVKEAIIALKPVRIIIDGEEDLLTIPILAFYPPNTTVLYGQPKMGIVVVSASSKKEKASEILTQMGLQIQE